MPQNVTRLRVAIPVPIAGGFDYRWDSGAPPPAAGCRVRVPFGRREQIGIVVDGDENATIEDAALKDVIEVLDQEPLIDDALMQALLWASDYYHHPLGEVLAQALPGLLRRGRDAAPAAETAWFRTPAGRDADVDSLRRKAPRQAEALDSFDGREFLTPAELREAGVAADALRRLEQRGWLTRRSVNPGKRPVPARPTETPPTLSPDQEAAVDAMRGQQGFLTALLYGVTGSGKTEVFLRLIDEALGRGRQCLLLVPEIGLTPQLVRRLSARFHSPLAVFHSRLTESERLDAWHRTRSGEARLVVGTRSAAFAPLSEPGLIVVDEEHDPSFKQQSGFRYSGRDLAIMRAKLLDIPILLASATPSLESYRNAVDGRYRLLSLPQRIGSGGSPDIRIIDLNQHAVRQGLSTPLIAAMEQHLERGNQILLFINRRGFAPALFCPGCETAAECPRCDARLTVHSSAGRLRCHHCGRSEPLRWTCPDCGNERIGVGSGTERVTTEIAALFPDQTIARLDRDVVSGREALGQALAEIEAGSARIIVGTQLLTKGHDFPDVTLVGVLNADQGLFGTDFRSEERLAQTIVQVSGRAGRRDRRGEVLIQTHYPKHPLLRTLLAGDYGAFAGHALVERRATSWPPYSHLAIFRAEAHDRDRVFAFLERLRSLLGSTGRELRVLGPTPDWMERRDGRFRAQLLLQSSRRPVLHTCIRACRVALVSWPETRRVRWAIDVDPAEL